MSIQASCSQEVFDKIDRSMSQDDVIALAGKPSQVIKVDPANFLAGRCGGRDAGTAIPLV